MLHIWSTVVIPILLGCFAIAAMNILRRYAVKDGTVLALPLLTVWYALTAVVFGSVYTSLWGLQWPALLPRFLTAVLCSAAVSVFIQFFNVKAASIDKGEVSFTAPLQAMTPGLITVLAITLGEYPSRVGIAGIALMATGSYILMWEKAPDKWYEYFGPLRRAMTLFYFPLLSSEERNKTLVVTFALGSAAFGTVGLLFDGLATRRGINLQGIILSWTVQTILMSFVYFWWHMKSAKPQVRTKELMVCFRKYALLIIAGMAIAWVLHVILINPAFQTTYIAYVGTLKRFSILLSVGMGYLIFHEHDIKKRIGAAVLIVAGAVLISMDDLPVRIAIQMERVGL